MTHCSFPVKGPRQRQECGHRATARYLVDGQELPRCRRHDSREARALAEERGYPVEAA